MKLPIVIQYGDESEWDEEERARMLGDDFVFACGDGDKENGENEATNQVIDTDEEVDTNEALIKEEDEVKHLEMITGKYKILKTNVCTQSNIFPKSMFFLQKAVDLTRYADQQLMIGNRIMQQKILL